MLKNKYCLNVGLGDLIVCKSQLLQMDVPQIMVSPNLGIAKSYRSESYQKFAIDLIKTIYVEPVFAVTTTQDSTYQRANWRYFNKMGIQPKWFSLREQLCVGDSLDIGSYIIINMKVRGMNSKLFRAVLPRFRAVLKNLKRKYKLVFIGERKIGMCREYSELAAVGRLTFSLHPHIKDLADLDLTIPELGVTAPTVNDLKKKCVYIRDAEAVINCGHGGNVLLSAAIAKKTFNFFANKESVGSLWFVRSNPDHLEIQTIGEFEEKTKVIL